MLYLLEKGLGQLQELLNANLNIQLTHREHSYLRTIRKVHEQQTFLMSYPPKELKDRIVSLPKPYIRPIVRGKEGIEFGMKVHMMQVDGICLFDEMDFNTFNDPTG